MIDFIYPPKPIPVETRTEPKLEKEKGEEENRDKQASGDELVRITNIFLCVSFVIPLSYRAKGDRYLDIRF